MFNRKGEWGQNLPPKLTVEGSGEERKRKDLDENEGNGKPPTVTVDREVEDQENDQAKPPAKRKKVDSVDSSLAENITAKKKIMTVKQMLQKMGNEGRQREGGKFTVSERTVNHVNFGNGKSSMSVISDRGENKNSIFDILWKSKQTKISFFQKVFPNGNLVGKTR